MKLSNQDLSDEVRFHFPNYETSTFAGLVPDCLHASKIDSYRALAHSEEVSEPSILQVLREAKAPLNKTQLCKNKADLKSALAVFLSNGQIINVGTKTRPAYVHADRAEEWHPARIADRIVSEKLAGGLKPVPWTLTALKRWKVPFPKVRDELRPAIQRAVEAGRAITFSISRSPYLLSVPAIMERLPASVIPTAESQTARHEPDIIDQARRAYHELSKERGTPVIKVLDLQTRTGIPKAELIPILEEACRMHQVNPIRGETSALSEEVLQVHLTLNGQPYYSVEFLS